MRFLSIRDLRSKPAEIWKTLPSTREMVVTSNGRPIAVLSAVTEENLEETLAAIRRARAVTSVSELQLRSVEHGTDSLTMDEIDAEITEVRRQRRQRDTASE